MKKNRLLGLLCGIIGFAGIFYVSCEIGLGAAVDVEPPAIEINCPEVDAVIRDSFAVKGTWSDDGEIESVSVVLERTDKSGSPIELEGEITQNEDTNEDRASGTWRAIVNPVESGIIDGSYQATISIKDKGQHVTTQTRTFCIDNTAPVVVLQRPSSKIDSVNVDSYGQAFTLTGQAADDNNVSLIRVNIYSDPECTNLIHYVDLNNVPPTIENDVARFEENIQNDYSKIYGSTTKNGTKQFYCAIVAYDGAQRYPIEGNQSSEDTHGNYTTTYYLYEDIATAVLNNYNCKVTDVYHMFNGTYAGADSSRSAEVVNSVKEILNEKTTAAGSFTLNPANNPTFSVSGRNSLKTDGSDFTGADNDLSNDSDLIIEVAVGLDAIPLKADTLRVYLQECDARGAVINSAKIYPVTSSYTKSGTSYKFVTRIKKDDGCVDANGSTVNLAYNNMYLVYVEGTDEKNTPVVPAGKGYGVKLVPSGAAPTLNSKWYVNPTTTTTDAEYNTTNTIYINEYKDNTNQASGNSVLSIKGTVQTEADDPTISILLDGIELPNVTVTGSNGSYVYSCDISATKFTNSNSTLLIKASLSGKTSQKDYTVVYDKIPPAVESITISPVAYKYTDEAGTKQQKDGIDEEFINGTVKINITINDDGDSQVYKNNTDTTDPKNPKVELVQNGTTLKSYSLNTNGGVVNNINTKGSDPAIQDGKPLTVRVTVYDKAGNKTVTEKEYSVDQSTDKPVLLPKDASFATFDRTRADSVSSTSGNTKNLYSPNQTMSVKLIDDDGLSSATIQLYNGASYSDPVTGNGTYNNLNGVAEYQADYTMPENPGIYKVVISSKDKNGIDGDTKTFYVRVTAAAPTLTTRINNEIVTSNTTGVTAGAKNSITATINISSDQKPFTLERKVYSSTDTNNANPIAAYTKTFAYNGTTPTSGNLNSDNPTITDTFTIAGVSNGITASGSYKIVYTATDTNTKVGRSSTTFTVDNDKPTITDDATDPLKVPTSQETENTSYTFKGKATDIVTGSVFESGVEKVEMTFMDTDGTPSSSATLIEASGTTSWNKEIVFGNYKASGEFFAQEGTKYLYVRAIDSVGNIGDWKKVSFMYDTAKPVIAIDNKTASLGKVSYTLTGTVTETNGFASGTKLVLVEKVNGADSKTADITLTQGANGVYTWSQAIPLSGHENSSGEFSYELTIKDKANKSAEPQTFKAERDLDEPKNLTLTTPTNATYGENSISLSNTLIKGTMNEAHPNKIYYKLYKETTEPEPENYTEVDIQNIAVSAAPEYLGNWSFAVDGLTDGEYTLKYYADDLSGNKCTAQTQNFMVDMAAPVITYGVYKITEGPTTADTDDIETFITGSDTATSINLTEGKGFKLKGKISDNNGISAESIKINGSDAGVSYDSSTGDWSYPLSNTITEGTYNCIIEVTDKSGNGKTGSEEIKGKTTTLGRTVVFDKTAPTGTVASITDGWLKAQGETYISGTADDGTTGSGLASIKFTLKKDGATVINGDDLAVSKNWTKSINVDDYAESNATSPVYTIELLLTDNVGLTNTVTQTFKLDRSIPEVKNFAIDRAFINNVNKDTTGNAPTNKVTFTGNIYDGSQSAKRSVASAKLVAYKDGSETAYKTFTLSPGTAASDFGKFTYSIELTGTNDALEEGTYEFQIQGTDYAGRTCNSEKVTLVVDTTNPTGSFNRSDFSPAGITDSSSNYWYNTTSINMNVTVTETNIDTVEAGRVDGTTNTVALWQSFNKVKGETNKWEGKPDLEEGKNTVKLRLTDKAGNTYETECGVYVDITPPSTITAYDEDGSTITGTKLVNGEADLVFYVAASDELSGGITTPGIAEVKYSNTAGVLQTSGTNNGRYKITVPKASLTSITTLKVRVTDKVGKYSDLVPFSLKTDNKEPRITITSPTATMCTNGVNGKVTFAATVYDDLTAENDAVGTLKSVELWYADGASGQTTAPTSNSDWYQIDSSDTITASGSNYSFNVVHELSNSSKLLTLNSTDRKYELQDDTTTAEKYIWLKVVAKDEAGWTKEETKLVKIDRNTDRPVIKFSNLSDDGTRYIMKYVENSILEGIISDDDADTSTTIKTLKISETAITTAAGWSSVLAVDVSPSGDFKYTPASTDDGTKELYFYIEDNQGGVFFTSATTTLQNPYQQLKSDSTTKADNKSVLTYVSDNTSPKVDSTKMIGYTGTTVPPEEGDTPSTDVVIGGTKKNKAKFTVKASDNNGIKNMQLDIKVGENVKGSYYSDSDGTFDNTTEATKATWELSEIDFSSYTTGSVNLVVTIKDNCDLSGNANYSFYVDNSGPTIKITSPKESDETTGVVVISGTSTDVGQSSSDTIKFVIPTKAQKTACTTWLASHSGKTDVDYYNSSAFTGTWEGKITTGTAVSAFSFTFDGDNSNNNYKLDKYTKEDTNNTTYGNTIIDDSYYKLPIFFKSEDKLGNSAVSKFTVKFNPDADKPKTKITYPSESDYDKDENGVKLTYATLGGEIRINGAIEIPSLTTTPDRVYIQIAPASGSFDNTAKTYISGKEGYTVKTITNVKTDVGKDKIEGLTEAQSSSWWGIEAVRSSNAWSININTSGELDNTDGTINELKIRACGINAEGKMGNWSDPVYIHIDASAPEVTSGLYQFTTNTLAGITVTNNVPNSIAAEKAYEAGMFLKDQWYIGAKVEDDDKVTIDSVKKGNTTLTRGIDYKVFGEDTATAWVFVQVDKDAGALTTYTIKATDQAIGGKHSTTPSFELNVDNTAPTISAIKSDEGYPIAKTKQTTSNKVITFGAESVDNGSGFKRLAFYFKRGDKIELPIPAAQDAANNKWKVGTAYTGTLIETSDGMNGVNLTGTTTTASGKTTFTSSSISSYAFIRKGGLIKIAGSYYLITGVSGNAVTFDSNMTTAPTTAFFPAVMVIDNTSPENSSWTGAVNEMKGDDGDGMAESIRKAGTTWTWDASIYAGELDDGEVELVCVAFDNADNYSSSTTKFMLANHTPRLSKVYLATDLNGNGSFTDDELGTSVIESSGSKTVEKYYNALNSGSVQEVVTLYGNTSDTTNSTTDSMITMRDTLGVAFEFVGDVEGYGEGTGTMYYKMSVSQAAINAPEGGTTAELITANSPFTESGSGNKYMTANVANFYNKTSQSPVTTYGTYREMKVSGETDYNSTAGYYRNFLHLTLWDSTNNKAGTADGEKTPINYTNKNGGTSTYDTYESFGAQWTVVNIPLYMDLVDGVAPTVTIANPTAEGTEEAPTGHVDLKSTITGKAPFTATSGEFDDDDKVSGTIKFTGTLNDDKRIASIKLTTSKQFSGTAISSKELAKYNATNGKFQTTDATPADITPGTTVITPATGIDFKILTSTFSTTTGHTVTWEMVVDTTKVAGVAAADVNFTVTAGDGTNNTNAQHKVDVVPYITSAKRNNEINDTHRSKLGKYQVVIGDTLNITGFNLPTTEKTNATPYAGFFRATTGNVKATSITTENKITSDSKSATAATLTVPGNSGYVVAVTNGIVSLNNMNDNAQDNNKQGSTYGTMHNDTDEWTDDVYLSAWKNDEYFAFSNDPISPAMDKINKTGSTTVKQLYAGWGSQGAKFWGSTAGTSNSSSNGNAISPSSTNPGEGGRASQYFGDPPSYYDIITDADGNKYNLLLDCWQGTTNYWGRNFVINKNSYFNFNSTQGSGGITASNSKNLRHVIERMGGVTSPDNADSGDGLDEIFNQFLNPRVAYYNGVVYASYYDRYAKCLKYAAIQPTTSYDNNTTDVSAPTIKYATEGIYNNNGTYRANGDSNNISGNYKNGACVVAGYDTTVSGGSPTKLDVGIWSAVAVDTGSSAPVIAYYDNTNRRLMIATGNGNGNKNIDNHKTEALARSYPLNSNSPVYTAAGQTKGEGDAWNRQVVTGSANLRLGQYVSMVVDGGNNLHIAAYGTAGGNKLYYIYGARSAYGTYTFTTTCVDAEGAGTWTDIQLENPTGSGAAAKPVISYYDPSNDSSENAIKVAYLENGVWDTMTAPIKSSAVSNRVTLALDVTDGASLASATANNSKLAVGYVTSRFDCIYLRKE